MRWRLAAALLVILAAAACTPAAPRLSEGVVVPGGVPITPEHTLSPGDQFEVRFPFAPENNDRLTVGMDGTVAPRLLGSLTVGGLTVPEAAELLKQRYAAMLKLPELSITMRRYAPETVYVDGWVARPGLVRSEVPLTLARALARVGGVKTGARTGDVLVMRKNGDGSVRTYSVALGSYAGAGAQDPLLKSFDVVYVPQTAITAVSEFAKQYYMNVPFAVRYELSPTPTPTIIAPGAAIGAEPAPPPPTVAAP